MARCESAKGRGAIRRFAHSILYLVNAQKKT